MDIKEEIATGIASAFKTLGFGGGKPAPQGDATPEQHPVLTAALAAGLDTPEKLTALKSDQASENPILKAALAAGITSVEQFSTLQEKAKKTDTPDPVQAAVLAAGIDTPEKFAQLEREGKAGREALTAARAEANLAAVAYYGKNAEGLAAAKDLIESEHSYTQLTAKAEQFWAGAPGADHPEKRLSQGGAPEAKAQRAQAEKQRKLAAGGPEEGTAEERIFRGSSDYYNQFNGGAKGAGKQG